ncbi:hypothetical protein GCM10010387_63190 [Streptomyces inusitatus]|uniref:Right handed beta helix domain-containing protein n=1 Tax=Streptomyces inusitatus TaxID=68221 RepID=A0A918QP43_9ACTN|nr:right-handed parallel beta-helix repeat-containing protein [Streptomyces inusitatus]GGZ60872.1 hypothetical protein GCM10010387_63190 [Streptomyces inusitatus]
MTSHPPVQSGPDPEQAPGPQAAGRAAFRGPAVWLSGAALVTALAALVIALADNDDDGPEIVPGATQAGPHSTWSVRPGTLPTDAGADADADSPEPSSTDTGAPSPVDTITPTPGGPLAPPAPSRETDCPPATVTVADARSLQKALADARPGDNIRLSPTTYTGRFIATAPAAKDKPITLCGPSDAVLDGDGIKGGYALHLNRATHWKISGFTIRNAQKGVMADSTHHTTLDNLTVHDIGDEAIHFRNHSTQNTIRHNTIHTTGLRKPKYGEGIYIGTAKSNWCTITQCQPDNSDNNRIANNHITKTTAEAIDVKEGTSNGTITHNIFDGTHLTGKHNDSWIDIKGNNWLIQNNTGHNTPQDGYQTHQILKGWGIRNTFNNNTAHVNGPGYGYNLTAKDNTLTCSNTTVNAAQGHTNTKAPCGKGES